LNRIRELITQFNKLNWDLNIAVFYHQIFEKVEKFWYISE
jgi:hypothetical protein